LNARQPFLESIDLDQPADVILARVRALVTRYGATGHVDRDFLAAQDL
jgi:hypothetical protein